MRAPLLPVCAGVLVAAAGAVGLIRGAAAQPVPSASSAGIVVTNAYVRAPVPPSRTAAAYFTVANTTGRADRLISVDTDAGAESVLHTLNPDGSMSVVPNGVVVRAHSRLVLATGRGHVMIERTYSGIEPGRTVHLELDFRRAGVIHVAAPVIAVGAPVPGGH